MTDDGYLMVDFYQHCSTCEHEKLNDWEDPCNECLEHAMNLNSTKPVNWEEKKR